MGHVYIANSASNRIRVYMLGEHKAFNKGDDLTCKPKDDIVIMPKKKFWLFDVGNKVEPGDLIACTKNGCLYMLDKGNWCIWRISVHINGSFQKWVTLNGEELSGNHHMSLSVMIDGRLLVISNNPPRLECHHRDEAELKSEVIDLPEDMQELTYAVQMKSSNFLVCHGWTRSPLRRICEVTMEGELLRSFGSEVGAGDGQLNYPTYMAVDKKGRIIVADFFNNRVMVVDSSLKESSVVMKWEYESDVPSRFLFHSADAYHQPLICVARHNGSIDVYYYTADNQ